MNKADVNDDEFEYEAAPGTPPDTIPWRQCISGFGRNTIDLVRDATESARYESPEEQKERLEQIEWHIQELVRWCRHFNRKDLLMKKSRSKENPSQP